MQQICEYIHVPKDGFPLQVDNDGKDTKDKNGDSGNCPGYHIFQLHCFDLKSFLIGGSLIRQRFFEASLYPLAADLFTTTEIYEQQWRVALFKC